MVYRLEEGVIKGPSKALVLGLLLLACMSIFGTIVAFADKNNVTPVNSPESGSSDSKAAQTSSHKTSVKQTIKHEESNSSGGSHDIRSLSCKSLFSPMPTGLAHSANPQLRKLAQYDQLCNGAAFAKSSFFLPTPTTDSQALAYAHEASSSLKQYAAYGIRPLVFLEPASSGGNIDLIRYAKGDYDEYIDKYFSAIKTYGVTDSMMGTWVILPEGNIPVWSTIDPGVFSSVVSRTIRSQKKYFPGSRSSILLDGKTSASWGQGSYVSLLPYVKNIPKGLVDSFGLQGFPWASPANQPWDNLYDPKAYLPVNLADEAARNLKVNDIWINTGTFEYMYTNNPSQKVAVRPSERQHMLDGVLAQARSLKAKGYGVSIHLFSEDKSAASEATDWSYWHTSPGKDSNAGVLMTFIHDAVDAHVPLWLYDSYEH